jgi:hypothetical protein
MRNLPLNAENPAKRYSLEITPKQLTALTKHRTFGVSQIPGIDPRVDADTRYGVTFGGVPVDVSYCTVVRFEDVFD